MVRWGYRQGNRRGSADTANILVHKVEICVHGEVEMAGRIPVSGKVYAGHQPRVVITALGGLAGLGMVVHGVAHGR